MPDRGRKVLKRAEVKEAGAQGHGPSGAGDRIWGGAGAGSDEAHLGEHQGATPGDGGFPADFGGITSGG